MVLSSCLFHIMAFPPLKDGQVKCQFLTKVFPEHQPCPPPPDDRSPFSGLHPSGVCVRHCMCVQRTTLLCDYSSMSLAPPVGSELEEKGTSALTISGSPGPDTH